MQGIADIHCHILPELDDGAASVSVSLEMARLAKKSGVDIVVATPHSLEAERNPRFFERVLDATDFLNDCLFEENIDLKIIPGMEIFATDDTLSLLNSGLLLPLGNTDNVLIEFDFDDSLHRMGYILYELVNGGYTPVIAHPERYFDVIGNPEVADEWIDMGCKLQINKGSILGRFGAEAAHTARDFIRHGKAFAVASDAHGAAYRTPHMGEAADELIRLTDEKTAKDLLCTNPYKILNIKGE